MLDSQVRLFLSFDIVGSSTLKQLKNHQLLAKKISESRVALEQLISIHNSTTDFKLSSEENLIQVLSLNNLSEEDHDWSVIINNTFKDFHDTFIGYVDKMRTLKPIDRNELYPWKNIGDELIYSVKVMSKEIIHDLIICFLKTLRKFDEKYKQGGLLRLKGNAWTVEFPIRNRIIHLPFPEIFRKGNNGRYISTNYLSMDYLGPEMDIGFRIGKCTWAGILAVSIELVEFLGEVDKDQIQIAFVGWEVLKGVWNERPYPIFWAVHPDDDKNSFSDMRFGDQIKSKFVESFLKDRTELLSAKEQKKFAVTIRENLPKELGVVKPYILAEGDPIPIEHEPIREMLAYLKSVRLGIEGKQSEKGVDKLNDIEFRKLQSKIKKKLL